MIYFSITYYSKTFMGGLSFENQTKFLENYQYNHFLQIVHINNNRWQFDVTDMQHIQYDVF